MEQRYAQGIKVTWVGVVGNILLTAVKTAAGVVAGSTAMVADAFHSASDIAGSIVVLGGLKLASKPADASHHYGHGKLEAVVAKLIATLLVLTGAGIGWGAIGVLRQGAIAVPGALALAAAGLSIVAKEGMYRYTIAAGRRIESSAVIADAWHHRTDALSSVAALIGVGGARLGVAWLDPAAGLLVAVMIIKSGVKIYLNAVRELIDTAPPREMVREIARQALTVDGVKSVHEVRARYYGPRVLVDLKLCVNRRHTVQEGHDIGARAKEAIIFHLPKVEDVLVHINPCAKEGDIRDPIQCRFCEERKKLGWQTVEELGGEGSDPLSREKPDRHPG